MKNIKSFKIFESLLAKSAIQPEKEVNMYLFTVVSKQDDEWGIVGDYSAISEERAIEMAKAVEKEHGFRSDEYRAFQAYSDELNDFIENNNFIE